MAVIAIDLGGTKALGGGLRCFGQDVRKAG